MAAKLALFNRVRALHYEQLVRECDTVALVRLLREPRERVLSVTEQPLWLVRLEAIVARSTVPPERFDPRKPWAYDESSGLKYCARCMGHFYHSWIHNLSWVRYCFVHTDVPLAPVSARHSRTPELALVAVLHAAWLPRFGRFLREPGDFDQAFADLSNRQLMHRARGLGALFGTADCDSGTHKSGLCEVRASCINQGLTVIHGDAPTHGALVRGIVSVVRQTSEHALNRHETQKFAWQGSARFGRGDEPPEFWDHLAQVLSAAVLTEQRTLLHSLVARLSLGHEGCLRALAVRHERGDHDVASLNNKGEPSYLAYRVRHQGVCPRLVTLDLLAQLLHPYFLRRLTDLDLQTLLPPSDEIAFRDPKAPPIPEGPEVPDAAQATSNTPSILDIPEWQRYRCTEEVPVPQGPAVDDFAHHLRALEWAIFRIENNWGSLSLQAALSGVVRDMRLVVIVSRHENGETQSSYLGPDGPLPPDWAALSQLQPSHEEAALRALDELDLAQLSSIWRSAELLTNSLRV